MSTVTTFTVLSVMIFICASPDSRFNETLVWTMTVMLPRITTGSPLREVSKTLCR